MVSNSTIVKRDDQIEMELPPGFRFHPTDEELITHYLSKKILDSNFFCEAIGEVDMNKIEPWELPWRAKLGESEWYFFSVKDKKYPTGLRTNRATAYGYWKATGKDKEICRGKTLVGMKKTLVFYKGRAPKGEKSNWVTHEYRLEGKFSSDNLPRPNKNDWVISRVFYKTSGGKKVHISGLMKMESEKTELLPSESQLPLLMDPSSFRATETETGRVHCFSNPIVAPQHTDQNMITCFNNSILPPSNSFDPLKYPQFQSGLGFQYPGSNLIQDPSIFRNFIWNYGQNMNHALRKQREMVSLTQETAVSTGNSSVGSNLEMGKRSFEDQEAPSTSIGAEDLDLMWNFEIYLGKMD